MKSRIKLKVKALTKQLKARLTKLELDLAKTLTATYMIVLGVLSVYLVVSVLHKYSIEKEIKDNTVMILSLNKRSGGSGSIIKSENNKTEILTNGHVCEILEHGGIVVSDKTKEEYLVVAYTKAKTHDLCLVEIFADLDTTLKIAKEQPKEQDTAYISGHPRLQPVTVTEGYFSQNELVEVVIGMEECEKEDWREDTAIYCIFFGGLPVIQTYETTLVTALIMPGSSGSAVYNSKAELSGVVFAGRGDLSFASIVPYHHVLNFLNDKSSWTDKVYPVTKRSPLKKTSTKKMRELCKTANSPETSSVCKKLNSDYIWSQP